MMNLIHNLQYSPGSLNPIAADLLEGMEVTGKKVFIKPNWVQPPLRWDSASCTRVEILSLVVDFCLQNGAEKVVIGECGFKGQWETTLAAGGYSDLLGDERVILVPLQDGENFHKFKLIRHDDGDYLSLFGARFSEYLLDCDYIVNVPKLKMHSRALMTCSIKNMMGAMTQKGSMHPGDSINILHKRLCDLYFLFRKLPPMFTVVDGIVGSGYAEQQGVPVEHGVLLSGTDPWEIDCTAAWLMGIEPDSVPYLRYIKQQLNLPYPSPPPTDYCKQYDLPFMWK